MHGPQRVYFCLSSSAYSGVLHSGHPDIDANEGWRKDWPGNDNGDQRCKHSIKPKEIYQKEENSCAQLDCTLNLTWVWHKNWAQSLSSVSWVFPETSFKRHMPRTPYHGGIHEASFPCSCCESATWIKMNRVELSHLIRFRSMWRSSESTRNPLLDDLTPSFLWVSSFFTTTDWCRVTCWLPRSILHLLINKNQVICTPPLGAGFHPQHGKVNPSL